MSAAAVRRASRLVAALVAVAACGPAASPPAGSAPAASPPAGSAPAASPSASPGGAVGSPGPATVAPSGPASPPGTTGPGASPSASAAAPPERGTWARVEVDGPSPQPREDHTWTLDESGGTAYLFGGRAGGQAFGDLWTFDLDARRWARLEADEPAPAARFGHEAVWVPGRGLVVTLGQAGSDFFADAWLFDPGTASWTALPGAGSAPVARYGSCSGQQQGQVWISHGFTEDGVRFADTLAYDLAAMRWTDVTPADGERPVKRCLHACWWTEDGRFVLYGGQTNGAAALGDLWALDPRAGSWSELEGQAPAARQLAAVGRVGSATILFGGRDVDRRPLADAWVLADAGGGFVRLQTSGETPVARSGAAFVRDEARNALLLFGGLAERERNDLWELALD